MASATQPLQNPPKTPPNMFQLKPSTTRVTKQAGKNIEKNAKKMNMRTPRALSIHRRFNVNFDPGTWSISFSLEVGFLFIFFIDEKR